MKLQLHTQAPTSSVIDIWDNTIDIPNSEQWIYLSFHRFADCPFCNLRTHELIKNIEKFNEKNIKIISIWPSEKRKLLQHSDNSTIGFHLVSDLDKKLYRMYHVTQSSVLGGLRMLMQPNLIFKSMRYMKKSMAIDSDPTLMPASFLIDPKGLLRLVHYGKNYGDHPEIESIFKVVDSQ
jgi:peroxiredoxin